jgi:hypothetical protein
MLVQSAISLFATTFLLTTTTSAAPTRTHCRCTVVADTQPQAELFTSSNAHWRPAESSPKAVVADICSTLGPELEHFQHTEPDLYKSYLSSNSDQQRPFSTNLLLNFAKGNEVRRREENKREPRPTSRPHQRIVCRSEADPFTAYQGSFITLWVLQIIVTVAILACVAEGVHLSLRWYGTSESAMMQWPGSQTLLLEFSGSSVQDIIVSGTEKNGWTNASTPMLIVQGPNGERMCVTYAEDDDDDEMNRPVM